MFVVAEAEQATQVLRCRIRLQWHFKAAPLYSTTRRALAFLIVALVGVPPCFLAGYAATLVPGISRIL